MAILKKTASFTVPTIDDIDPHFSELVELEAHLREQERKAQQLVDDIRRRRVHTGPQIRSDRIAELAGDDPSAAQPMPAPVPTAADAARDLAEIQIALDRVTKRRQAAREAASAQICERAKPHITAQMKALAKALEAAHEAHAEITRITDTLDSDDVTWVSALPNNPATPLLGFARDNQSRLALWFREAVTEGAITHKDIPEALR